MDQSFMKERKILPLVLSMSLPMVISMAVNALYNIVDSYFVAKLSEEAMTALALVYPIQNLITAIGVGIGIGINAGIAYYLGAKKQTTANQIATQGIALSVLHGILLTVLCTAGLWKFLKGFSADLEVNLMAITYGNRVLLFSVVITLGITFEKIFQSVGKMKVSMFSMICGCLINILLDPLMIFGIGPFPAMGIAGAAYATGIGQTATLLIYLIFYFADPIPVKIQLKYLKPEKHVISRIYAVGIPATLNMALPSLLISSLNGILSGFSEKYVLVLGVYYKLQTFIYLSANGIIQGIRPLIGYNYGAGEKKTGRKNISDGTGTGAWRDGSRNADILAHPGKIDRAVHRERRDHPDRNHCTSYHQLWLYRVRRVCDLLRSTGRTRKGYTIFLYCVAAICHCHYSGSISVWKNTGSKRRMAGISGGRGIDSGVCNHTISEVR